MTNGIVGDRILVTGSGGVLGTAILGQLRKLNVAALWAPLSSECDLGDWPSVQKAWQDFQPSLVIHLAGRVSGVQGNLSFAGQAFYDNARINLNVIEASRLANTRKIVAAGTTAVYSDETPLPMRETDLWKGAPHGSEAGYAHAKRAMLAHLEAYELQYGLEFAYMICTNLYGPNDRFDEKYGHVVPSLVSRIDSAKRRGAPAVTVWGDGSPTRDFLYSEDAATAFITVAGQGTGVYNTASGSVVTIRELVHACVEVADYRGQIRWDTSKPKGQQTRAYDISRLRELGWRPSITLHEGLSRTFLWFSEHREDCRR